jgi:hypothetical protein
MLNSVKVNVRPLQYLSTDVSINNFHCTTFHSVVFSLQQSTDSSRTGCHII